MKRTPLGAVCAYRLAPESRVGNYISSSAHVYVCRATPRYGYGYGYILGP